MRDLQKTVKRVWRGMPTGVPLHDRVKTTLTFRLPFGLCLHKRSRTKPDTKALLQNVTLRLPFWSDLSANRSRLAE